MFSAQTYSSLNVTVFGKDNSSADVSISTLGISFASGHIVGEDYGSVTGYIMDGHFYGTVYLKDSVHYLGIIIKRYSQIKNATFILSLNIECFKTILGFLVFEKFNKVL